MPIYEMDKRTNQFKDHDEFVVRCDLSPESLTCFQLQFSLFEANDNNPFDGKEVYMTVLPDKYPQRGWMRLKSAVQMLMFGKISYWEEQVLYKPTVKALAERLTGFVGKMKDMEE